MIGRITWMGAALCLAAPLAQSQEPPKPPAPPKEAAQKAVSLAPGDPAPALVVEKWLKGAPVAAFQPGKVYVVEFWATWCGRCIEALPHLSALQAEYGDKVTIIGTNIAEDAPRTVDYDDKTLPMVEEFVAAQGERMAYTVAYDGASKAMDSSFMKAAGLNSIPSAFIIDQQGKIAWIGNPSGMDFALAEIVAGKWDPKTGPEREKQLLRDLAAIKRKLATDPAGAQADFEKLEATHPNIARHQDDLRLELQLATGQHDKAYAIIATQVEAAILRKDAVTLNELAWKIVDPAAKREKRDADLALRAAEHANRFSGDKEPAILDTLAHACFLKGDVKRAIELETKAVGLAEGQMKAELEKTLATFKSKNAQ